MAAKLDDIVAQFCDNLKRNVSEFWKRMQDDGLADNNRNLIGDKNGKQRTDQL